MWRTPEELVAIGLATSPILMANEGHNGLSRCVRTRVIGKRMVQAAHEAGCRILAMEALPNAGVGVTEHTTRPWNPGYLAQPEMIDLIDTALALGWTLLGYEADFDLAAPQIRDDPLSWPAANWRERQQADNLAAAIGDRPGEPMLIWVGNGHHTRTAGGGWTPMGQLLVEIHHLAPYCIDQLQTVGLGPGNLPNLPLTDDLARTLDALGGTAGFTADDPPPGVHVLPGFDAYLLSTDNAMIGPPPQSWSDVQSLN